MLKFIVRFAVSAALVFTLCLSPNIASALSPGGERFNGWTKPNSLMFIEGAVFNKGEVITVHVSNPSTTPMTVQAQFNPVVGAVPTKSTSTFPSSLTFTVAETAVYELGALVIGYVGTVDFSVTVVAPASPGSNTPDATNNTDAASNTIASASRGQATAIMGNIMSRLASAPSVTLPQEGRSQNLAASFNPDGHCQGVGQPDSREISLKDVAGFATFNTAQSGVATAGTGVSGIEQRRGIASGEPVTLWGHASFTAADNRFNKDGDDRRYDGDVWGYSLGADYRFHEQAIAGMAVGYTDTDMTTHYNDGNYKEKGWNFTPYIMYEPIDGALISLMAGYSFGDVDRTRDSSITGNTDSSMWYTAFEGEYRMQPSDSIPLELTARVGYLLSQKTLGAFIESDGTRVDKLNVNTSQLKPGVEVAYSFTAQGTILQPFIKADYVHDFVDLINNDSNALNLGGGLRVTSHETGFSGVIEGERQFLRDEYSDYTIKGLLAYNFSLSGDDGNELGTLAPYVKSNLDTAGGQVFGTGLKFTSADSALSCELDATHTLSSQHVGSTGAKLTFELAY